MLPHISHFPLVSSRFFPCFNETFTRIYQFSARLSDSGIKQNFSVSRLQAASKAIQFLSTYLLAASLLWWKKIENLSNQNMQCTFPRENTCITVSVFLIEDFSAFSGSALSSRVKGFSFPVHSTSLARHIALVKSCSTQWNKYPLKIIFRWK